MATAIIFIVIASLILLLFIACLIFTIIDGDLGDARGLWTIVSTIVAIGLFVGSIININLKSKSSSKELYKIESLIQEEFTLGVGSYNNCAYYYYKYLENNVEVIGKQNANKTTIIYNDEVQPYVLEIKPKWEHSEVYELYVPSNTTIIAFRVD